MQDESTCFPPVKPRLACDAPSAKAPAAFKALVSDYTRAYDGKDELKRIRLLSKIAISVFEDTRSQDYVDKLKYIDAQSAYSPEAMYDLGKALQDRWEATYGMDLGQKLKAGIADQNAEASLGEQRNNRRAKGRRIGGMIGGVVALTALGIAAIRHPTAIPRYNAVFRALLPATSMAAGIYVGGRVADHVSAIKERDLPLAPAHVMKLGIENDDFVQDEDLFAKVVVPMLGGVAAGEAVYALIEGRGAAATITSVVRGVAKLNKVATPAKVNPAVLVLSIVVTMMVEDLIGYAMERWEYRKLKNAVKESRDAVLKAIASGDVVAAYKGADALVLRTLALGAFSNKPVMEANAKFLKGISEDISKHCPAPSASSKTPVECPYTQSTEHQQRVDQLTSQLTVDVSNALDKLDQRTDADFQAYLALEVLESRDASAIQGLSEMARERLREYMDIYMASPQAWKDPNSASAQERFQKYVRGMRKAKDRELAQQLKDNDFVEHSGHTLLQVSALLRTTKLDYLQPQADTLMKQIAQEDAMLQALSGDGSGAPIQRY
jgi:hypothetical protein